MHEGKSHINVDVINLFYHSIIKFKLLDGKEDTYEMAERFGLTKTEVRKEIREFKRTQEGCKKRTGMYATDCP